MGLLGTRGAPRVDLVTAERRVGSGHPDSLCVVQIGPDDRQFGAAPEHDIGELRIVIEVRTRRLEGRLADQQRRADLIRDHLAGVVSGPIGVWLMLTEGAWSQT